MGYIATIKEAQGCLESLAVFNAGTLTANWELVGEGNRYIVRSYGVEIADYTEGAIHPTAYSHSKTTSKHANIVKKAWGI